MGGACPRTLSRLDAQVRGGQLVSDRNNRESPRLISVGVAGNPSRRTAWPTRKAGWGPLLVELGRLLAGLSGALRSARFSEHGTNVSADAGGELGNCVAMCFLDKENGFETNTSPSIATTRVRSSRKKICRLPL
jgi:hypothetical protein